MRYIVRTVDFDDKRKANVEELKKQIPNLEVFVDTKHDGYESWFCACEMLHETGGVILEDDVFLCKNFCERIEKIIEEKGTENVINFFEKPKKYFKTSLEGGSKFMWTQCVYLPPFLGNKMRETFEEFKTKRPKKAQGMAYDCLTAYVLSKLKMKYWRIRPCLVQHLPFQSVIGWRPCNRQTLYFIDDLEIAGIDYDTMEDNL